MSGCLDLVRNRSSGAGCLDFQDWTFWDIPENNVHDSQSDKSVETNDSSQTKNPPPKASQAG